MQTFQSLLRTIAERLDDNNIPHMIIGGQAVLLYGEPRLTKVIDITLGVDTDKFSTIQSLAAAEDIKPLVGDPERFAKLKIEPLSH